MACGQPFEVEQRHFVGGRIVQSGDKVGAVRYVYVIPVTKLPAHRGRVQQARQRARIHSPGLAATGATIQACAMRVVASLAAMTNQQYQARILPDQPHPAENAGGDIRLARHATRRCRIQYRPDSSGAGSAQSQAVFRGQRRASRQAPFDQLAQVAETQRLHQGKSRQRYRLERLPAKHTAQAVLSCCADFLVRHSTSGAVGDMQRRRQQAGKLGPSRGRAQRRVTDRQAKKPGKTKRLDIGRLCLEVTAQHLGADIDTERCLHRRLDCELNRRGGQQTGAELALVGNLLCPLPGVQSLLHAGAAGLALFPVRPPGRPGGIRVSLAIIEQGFPAQAYGQQVHQVVIIPAIQARLPALVGAPGRPTAYPHQHRLQVTAPLPRGYTQLLQGCGDLALRIHGQGSGACRYSRGAHQQRDTVVRAQGIAPTGVKATRLVRVPGCLVTIKVGGAELGHLVGDAVAPGRFALQIPPAVEQVTEQRHRSGGSLHPVQLRDELPGAQLTAACGQRLVQVVNCYLALVPCCAVIAGRQGHGRARHMCQCGRRLLEGLVDPAPVGVDRDHTIQRPTGRNALYSGNNSIAQRSVFGQCSGHTGGHICSPAGVRFLLARV